MRPHLDWTPRHDPRSRAYPVRGVLPDQVPLRRTVWEPPSVVLDQGSEGACVGFGWTAELLAAPHPSAATEEQATAYARDVYRRAQQIDEWAGESYDGTSVLAGAKVVQGDGHIGGYRWAFGVDDVRDAVIAHGPVVIGVPWYRGMYTTRPSGLVDVSGSKVGGHCLVVHGFDPAMDIEGQQLPVFLWRNSWGPAYGVNGTGYVPYGLLSTLLSMHGEACVPQDRRPVTLTGGQEHPGMPPR